MISSPWNSMDRMIPSSINSMIRAPVDSMIHSPVERLLVLLSRHPNHTIWDTWEVPLI